MWHYETDIVWKGQRRGEMQAEGKVAIPVATPPEFGGPPNQWSPEDLLTGAVASCLLTTTLFYVDQAGASLEDYTSHARGTMGKTPKGLAFTRIVVDIQLTVADPTQTELVQRAVNRAEQNCPISQSLSIPVEVRATVAAP